MSLNILKYWKLMLRLGYYIVVIVLDDYKL